VEFKAITFIIVNSGTREAEGMAVEFFRWQLT